MKKLYILCIIFITSAINTIGYSQCSLLKNFNTSYYGYSGTEVVNDKMIFRHKDNISGEELWISDGTASGTTLIKDINPGISGSSPKMIGVLNNNYYFFANNGVNGNELWKTDGTTAGTVLVKEIVLGAGGVVGSESCNGKIIGNELFFTVAITNNQWNLWKTDGTDIGTIKLSNFSSNFSGGIGFETLGNKIFFNYNNKLYVSDGTIAGTQQFGDYNMLSNTSKVFIKFKNHIYYFVPFNQSGQTTYQLWKTDGTLSGTSKVIDTYLGQTSYIKPPGMFAADSDNFYFETCEARELWKSDGTAQNTFKVKFFGSVISNMELINGILYFSAYENNLSGLWRSDGTVVGTYLIKNIPYFSGNVQGNEGYGNNRFYNYNNTLLFSANGSLYKSDGTNSGTIPVCNISQDITDTISRYNNNIYFFSPFYLHKFDASSLDVNNYNINSSATVNIYPNPSRNVLNIETNEHQLQKVELFDIQGKLLISEIAKGNKHLMEISHLPKTSYILRLNLENGIQNIKIIKN